MPFEQLSFPELPETGVRVLPADLADMLQVTQQAVSRWKREGKITVGADGRLDPAVAINELLQNGSPLRVGSRLLKPLVSEIAALHRRVQMLEGAADRLREQVGRAERNWLHWESEANRYKKNAAGWHEQALFFEQDAKTWRERASRVSAPAEN